jgi:NDP-sugar pyrophosphorylase family protein
MTHVVIPMSGLGERFIKAGYKLPKPLIEVDGKPMIEHVVSMFFPDDKFTFVCNQEHLSQANFNLREVLNRIAPHAEIISIDTHRKGPVYAVAQCFDRIEDNEATIVNYCDFYSYWNYADFLAKTRSKRAAGAVPAYRNFHPHMLGTDNYAFIKEKNLWLEAIQEKKPFTDNRMAEFASNGTYYFSRGQYVKHYFQELMKQDIQVNGEYYVSMIYNLMVADELRVLVYEVDYMLQWGTPRDLEEYQHWSDYFTRLAQEGLEDELRTGQKNRSANLSTANAIDSSLVNTCLIPMAGKGSRFADVGYLTPKPLIPVSNKPMVVLACDNLPPASRYVFVAQKEHLDNSQLKGILTEQFPNVSVVAIDGITAGQASSCQLGIDGAEPAIDPEASLLIGACDNGIVYDQSKWQALMADQTIDMAAFSFRNHPSSERNPQMFGWLKVAGQVADQIADQVAGQGDDKSAEFPIITGVSVKKAISDNPRGDHAIVGAFFFRKAKYFDQAMKVMLEQDIRVNGEFYVDSMVGVLAQSGLKCVAFEVVDYISFGIPNDLKTFDYWQSFFKKCSWHEYKKEVSKIQA